MQVYKKNIAKHFLTQNKKKRYPTSGSFIRYQPDKVLFGQTFMQAFKDKYTAEQEENSVNYDKASDKGELYWGGNKNLVVETYGFGKVQRSLRYILFA
jgi:hypothetical protein